MNTELIKKIQQCPNLPSLPSIAVQVLDLAGKPDVDIAEIARVISKDPALSTKILRTVNSSFYGRSQHVGTISHALVILGLQSVKTLVLGFSLVTTLNKNKSQGLQSPEILATQHFRRHRRPDHGDQNEACPAGRGVPRRACCRTSECSFSIRSSARNTAKSAARPTRIRN